VRQGGMRRIICSLMLLLSCHQGRDDSPKALWGEPCNAEVECAVEGSRCNYGPDGSEGTQGWCYRACAVDEDCITAFGEWCGDDHVCEAPCTGKVSWGTDCPAKLYCRLDLGLCVNPEVLPPP